MNSEPSSSTIKYWIPEFERGCASIFVDECPGRSTEITTSEVIKNIHDIVINDRESARNC